MYVRRFPEWAVRSADIMMVAANDDRSLNVEISNFRALIPGLKSTSGPSGGMSLYTTNYKIQKIAAIVHFLTLILPWDFLSEIRKHLQFLAKPEK